MQKIHDGEVEIDNRDDAEWEKEQEALHNADAQEDDGLDKDQAAINDLFKGWKEDADDYKRAEKTNKMKDPFLTYGVGLTNYF